MIEKKELNKRLRETIYDLTETYLSPVADENQFPSATELNSVRENATKLFLELGRKNPRYQEGWKVFLRIEKRFPGTRPCRLCRRLMDKLEKRPLGVITRITHAIEKSSQCQDKKLLREIVHLVDQEALPSSQGRDWEKYCHVLRPYLSQHFVSYMCQRLSSDADYDWAEKTRQFPRLFGWAAFLDVREQNKTWDTNGKMTACRMWLQSLASVELEARLWKISRTDSPVVPLPERKILLARQDAAERKRKSRAGKKSPKIV
jgi:hypothetical protein